MLTLQDLRGMVKEPKNYPAGMPSVNQLEKSGCKILVREMAADIEITVYENGYVACRRGEESTVFRLRDCGSYHYGTATEVADNNLSQDVFEKENWYLRLYMEAEDRLNANYERKQRYYQVSLDGLNEDHCKGMGDYTWEGEHDFFDREDMKQFHRFLNLMTKKQQRVIILYFVDQMGTCDIAEELGITYQAVSDMIGKAIRRVRKKEGIDCKEIVRRPYNRRRTNDYDE